MRNKKALSAVIATLLLILLVVVAMTIVWTFVSKLVKDKTKGAESCFDVSTSEKVTINDYYTCYDSENGEVQFSINLGDVEINGLVVSISTGDSSKIFILTNDEEIITDLRPYTGSIGDPVKLPEANGGLTYTASGFSGAERIEWIKIAPIVEDKQCDATDTTYEIDDCSALVD